MEYSTAVISGYFFIDVIVNIKPHGIVRDHFLRRWQLFLPTFPYFVTNTKKILQKLHCKNSIAKIPMQKLHVGRGN